MKTLSLGQYSISGELDTKNNDKKKVQKTMKLTRITFDGPLINTYLCLLKLTVALAMLFSICKQTCVTSNWDTQPADLQHKGPSPGAQAWPALQRSCHHFVAAAWALLCAQGGGGKGSSSQRAFPPQSAMPTALQQGFLPATPSSPVAGPSHAVFLPSMF